MSNNWKGILASLAPTVASALGGPLAGMAVGVLSKTLLGTSATGDEKKDLLSIGTAILTGGTEALEKLKAAELEIKKIEIEANINFEQIAADDRASARQRQVDTGDNMTSILAMIVMIGFFATVGFLLAGKVDLDGQTGAVIGTMIGYVSAKAEQVITYYFGSSKGSSKKNFMISGMMQKLKATAEKF